VIVCRSAAEIGKMRAANQFVATVLAELEAAVQPGVTTADLDRLAETLVRDGGAIPAFKGYRGFPATLCASINDEVVHGIPSAKRELKDGDIISLDVGAKLGGYFGDSAVTVPVGKVPDETLRLLDATREALDRAIEQVQVGGRLSDIGHAVQQWVEAAGFSIVREFVGHGIGEKLHEEPQIPNYGPAGKGSVLRAGMVLAIEPMFNLGRAEVSVDSDGWTVRTRDKSASAHFEHTIALEPHGAVILGTGSLSALRASAVSA